LYYYFWKPIDKNQMDLLWVIKILKAMMKHN
jgi:hypothetical protein